MMGTSSPMSFCEISELLRICVDRSSEASIAPITAERNSVRRVRAGRGLAPPRPARTHRSAAQALRPDLWVHRHQLGQTLQGACSDVG